MARFHCTECFWTGPEAQVLTAPNPFAEETETMMGCPDCREAGTMRRACDTDGCTLQAGNGTPTDSGYVWSCFAHRPQKATP